MRAKHSKAAAQAIWCREEGQDRAWKACAVKIALPSYAAVKALRRACVINGRRTSWKLASAGWQGTLRVQQTVKGVRGKRDLKEVVAEQALEMRLLKRHDRGWGGDE